MSLAGRTLLTGLAAGICSLAIVPTSTATGSDSDATKEMEARVFTDGRLRAGHLETIRVTGFPGKGVTDISFSPTAICEDGCGVRSYRGGRTDARGAAEFKVRIPGTFFDLRNRNVYFRDGERIDVNVTWSGPNRGFAVGSAYPEPILVRSHGANLG
jgi:hypothetical protein